MHIVHNAVRNLFYREVNEPMAVWLGFFFAFSFSIFQSLQFSDAIVMRNQKKQKQKKKYYQKNNWNGDNKNPTPRLWVFAPRNNECFHKNRDLIENKKKPTLAKSRTIHRFDFASDFFHDFQLASDP